MGRKIKIQPTKECRVCGSTFSKPSNIAYVKWGTRFTCSKVCGATHTNHKGTYEPLAKRCKNTLCNQSFTKSLKDTHEHFSRQEYCSKSCAKVGKSGELSNSWIGDKVGYEGIHGWIRKTYGRPSFCEHCKDVTRRMYHWANISGEYKRDRKDWLRLCVPCHKKYDMVK